MFHPPQYLPLRIFAIGSCFLVVPKPSLEGRIGNSPNKNILSIVEGLDTQTVLVVTTYIGLSLTKSFTS